MQGVVVQIPLNLLCNKDVPAIITSSIHNGSALLSSFSMDYVGQCRVDEGGCTVTSINHSDSKHLVFKDDWWFRLMG